MIVFIVHKLADQICLISRMSNISFNLESICYDNCHLKKYALKREHISQRLMNLDYWVDRFHFGNHVDKWCKANCDPRKSQLLEEVNIN